MNCKFGVGNTAATARESDTVGKPAQRRHGNARNANACRSFIIRREAVAVVHDYVRNGAVDNKAARFGTEINIPERLFVGADSRG